jgi:hypothetical protein
MENKRSTDRKPCPKCKDISLVIKMYQVVNSKEHRRVMYCVNAGCGYTQPLPPVPEIPQYYKCCGNIKLG